MPAKRTVPTKLAAAPSTASTDATTSTKKARAARGTHTRKVFVAPTGWTARPGFRLQAVHTAKCEWCSTHCTDDNPLRQCEACQMQFCWTCETAKNGDLDHNCLALRSWTAQAPSSDSAGSQGGDGAVASAAEQQHEQEGEKDKAGERGDVELKQSENEQLTEPSKPSPPSSAPAVPPPANQPPVRRAGLRSGSHVKKAIPKKVTPKKATKVVKPQANMKWHRTAAFIAASRHILAIRYEYVSHAQVVYPISAERSTIRDQESTRSIDIKQIEHKLGVDNPRDAGDYRRWSHIIYEIM